VLSRPLFHGLVNSPQIELVQIAQQREGARPGQLGQAASRGRGAAGVRGGRLVRCWNARLVHVIRFQ
jgi:hypothetical protein